MSKSKVSVLYPLFITFFKAGTFTFAGGLAMLPVIEKDIVEKYALMERDEFLEYATLAQTLPGVIALNCACFVGRSVAGTPGMLIAGLGATISAFVLMVVATILMQFIPEEGAAMGAMSAIRAASSAMILSAAFSLGRHNLRSFFAVLVMLASFVLVIFLNVTAPVIMLLFGVVGYLYQRFFHDRKGAKKA